MESPSLAILINHETLDGMVCTFFFLYISMIWLKCCLYCVKNRAVPISNHLCVLNTMYTLRKSKSCGNNICFHWCRRSWPIFEAFVIWWLGMFYLAIEHTAQYLFFYTYVQKFFFVAAPNSYDSNPRVCIIRMPVGPFGPSILHQLLQW